MDPVAPLYNIHSKRIFDRNGHMRPNGSIAASRIIGPSGLIESSASMLSSGPCFHGTLWLLAKWDPVATRDPVVTLVNLVVSLKFNLE